jgi:hypothetical protein
MNDPIDKDEDLEHAPIGAIIITTLLTVVTGLRNFSRLARAA